MKDGDHLIWSNHDLDLDDWREELLEQYPDATETELYQLMQETNEAYLQDERANLNISLPGPILAICDIGRWNGRAWGYKEISSGNIRDCLYSDLDYATWYVDHRGDLRCEAIHHDGTNFYLYRMIRPGVSRSRIDRLKANIYDGIVTRADIESITVRLGDHIGKVYGWSFPPPGKCQQER